MEIPYVVEPRKDTGLNNSKIGIWLFLASEVMLFGGLFSGYVFLRIYADYPWPERTLPVLPGLINTFVLIASSVTVVFAWVSLKLREWRKFQMYMGITIACAAIFMVLKAVEYKAKFEHQAIRLDDYTVIEGHAHPQGGHGDDHGDHGHGPTKNWNIDAKSVDIDIRRVDDAYYEVLGEQYDKGKFALAQKLTLSDGTEFAEGTAISKELIDQAKADYLKVVAHNEVVDTEIGRDAWEAVRGAHPGKRYWEKEVKDLLAKTTKELKEKRKGDYMKFNPSDKVIVRRVVTFISKSGHAHISVNPYWGKLSNPKKGEESKLSLKDQTVISGVAGDSSININVDGIDFRHTVMKAEEKGIDPVAAINNSWLLKDAGMKKIWDSHKVIVAKLEEELKESGKEPTENERYRVNWQEIVALQKIEKEGLNINEMSYDEIKALEPNMLEGFAGPTHAKKEGGSGFHFPAITVPREQVRFESLFSPRWNTYYATYFTITGLHGIHVVAGALVLAYYLFFGRGMYNSKPEWLANRVEVGGLFWHFVDLVWIFLFPILYLM